MLLYITRDVMCMCDVTVRYLNYVISHNCVVIGSSSGPFVSGCHRCNLLLESAHLWWGGRASAARLLLLGAAAEGGAQPPITSTAITMSEQNYHSFLQNDTQTADDEAFWSNSCSNYGSDG